MEGDILVCSIGSGKFRGGWNLVTSALCDLAKVATSAT